MNPQDPLANLHPLREPEMINWWPLAPGWWMLFVAVIVTLVGLGYWLIKRYRGNAYRRQALRQLQQLHSHYQSSRNGSEFASQVNALLKRVALTAYPQEKVAAHHSESWQAFLNQQLPAGEQFQADFTTAAYRETCPDLNMEQLQLTATRWIKHHRRAA